MSQSLYEITEEMAKLDAILEASGGAIPEGEEGTTLQAMLEKYEWLEREKIDGYGSYWVSLKALAEKIEQEEERLSKRRRVVMNKVERLKEMARLAMERRKKLKLEGNMFTISLQKNGGAPGIDLKVDEPTKLPPAYQKTVVQADMEKIRKALVETPSEMTEIAEFRPVGYSVRIR